MPRNTREWAKRELDATKGNFEWIETQLLRVVDAYVEKHPEVAGPLLAIRDVLEQCQESVSTIEKAL